MAAANALKCQCIETSCIRAHDIFATRRSTSDNVVTQESEVSAKLLAIVCETLTDLGRRCRTRTNGMC